MLQFQDSLCHAVLMYYIYIYIYAAAMSQSTNRSKNLALSARAWFLQHLCQLYCRCSFTFDWMQA